jgi:hypothetical protein
LAPLDQEHVAVAAAEHVRVLVRRQRVHAAAGVAREQVVSEQGHVFVHVRVAGNDPLQVAVPEQAATLGAIGPKPVYRHAYRDTRRTDRTLVPVDRAPAAPEAFRQQLAVAGGTEADGRVRQHCLHLPTPQVGTVLRRGEIPLDRAAAHGRMVTRRAGSAGEGSRKGSGGVCERGPTPGLWYFLRFAFMDSR